MHIHHCIAHSSWYTLKWSLIYKQVQSNKQPVCRIWHTKCLISIPTVQCDKLKQHDELEEHNIDRSKVLSSSVVGGLTYCPKLKLTTIPLGRETDLGAGKTATGMFSISSVWDLLERFSNLPVETQEFSCLIKANCELFTSEGPDVHHPLANQITCSCTKRLCTSFPIYC